MTPQTYVFIGRSGCGKGTQADLLMKELTRQDTENPILYLETGQRFRDFTAAPGYSNKLARTVQEIGGLQPAFLAVWMWSDILVQHLLENEHLVVDGTPRKLGEAILFTEALKFYGRKPVVVYMNVSRGWSETRLGERHRSDDAQAMIKRRLDWYDAEVAPAVEYLRTSGDVSFFDVNGERGIEEINAEILGKVGLQ